jgi:hypothetical protein
VRKELLLGLEEVIERHKQPLEIQHTYLCFHYYVSIGHKQPHQQDKLIWEKAIVHAPFSYQHATHHHLPAHDDIDARWGFL